MESTGCLCFLRKRRQEPLQAVDARSANARGAAAPKQPPQQHRNPTPRLLVPAGCQLPQLQEEAACKLSPRARTNLFTRPTAVGALPLEWTTSSAGSETTQPAAMKAHAAAPIATTYSPPPAASGPLRPQPYNSSDEHEEDDDDDTLSVASTDSFESCRSYLSEEECGSPSESLGHAIEDLTGSESDSDGGSHHKRINSGSTDSLPTVPEIYLEQLPAVKQQEEQEQQSVLRGCVNASPAPAPAPADPQQQERSALLDRVGALYALQGRPCKACQELLSYCRAQGIAPESLQQELIDRGLPDAAGLAKMAQSVSDGLSDLSSDAGWQMVRDDELRLQYKHMSERGLHAFRARVELDAPVEHLVALTREADLFPTWNKYCTAVHVLQERSVTDIRLYISLWVPWPFKNVGFCIDATGAEMYDEDGRLVITYAGPDRKTDDPSRPLLPASAAREHKIRILAPSCLTFTPLPPKAPGGPSRTLGWIQFYVDPRVRHVPPCIISFVLRMLAPFMYGAVQQVLESAFRSADNPLPQRMRQRSALYDWVRRRSQAFLASSAGGAS